MRQLFLEKGAISIQEVAQPLLDADTALIEVYYSCISSGTESATISNAQQNNVTNNVKFISTLPQKIAKILESIKTNGFEGTKALVRGKLSGQVMPLGYSCAGRVLAVGKNIKKFRAGDFVACAGAGIANHADIVCVPENLMVHVSDKKFLKQASLTTIGSIALQGIRRAQLNLGETVCVIGLGLLGQITMQLARHSGCNVIGIDIMPERLKLAQELGAHKVYLASDPNLKKELHFATEYHGADCTIITAASESNAIMQQAMELTRKKGKVVLVGDVGLGLERSPLYQKEIDFLISCSYGPGRYDTDYEQKGVDYPFAYVRWTENRNMQAFIVLIEQGLINLDALISGCVTLENAESAYALLKEKKALSMVIDYEKKDERVSSHVDITPGHSVKKFIGAQRDTLRVGVVGAGGFAQIKLMPIISRMKNVKIHAVVDAQVATAVNSSKLYVGATALTDDTQLFAQDLVDVVVIASPHKFHAAHALHALQAGKAVFMEKPMVTDFAQLEELTRFLGAHPALPFCVDYNRSFAPFIQKIKQHIVQRSSPLMIHYRMNAGFIPKDHWVQRDIGGGRIIGEACHIFDLFYYLTDATPVAVSVESLKPPHQNLFATDNFSAQISFSDGSVSTLFYTSLGHADLGKERMELYVDGKTILMDDYKVLKGYGFAKTFDQTTTSPDKGHEALLTSFFAELKKETYTAPITARRLNEVAKLTLVIDQLASGGGGTQELA